MGIRIGIMGYGNLGRGVELAVRENEDLALAAVFTRRPEQVRPVTENVPVYPAQEAERHRDKVDVLVLCGGSATDLPEQTPRLARWFHVVDSYDNHGSIPAHLAAVDQVCRAAGTVGCISVGWDPGLFSLMRVYGGAVLPHSVPGTFWGPGVSQGHSDAIRRIEGVADARQYTIPNPAAMDTVRNGRAVPADPRQRHSRDCYVVLKEGADPERVERQIKELPGYFAGYETTVRFLSQEKLERDHRELPHGGRVICAGSTGAQGEHLQHMEFSLDLSSNPEFTGGVLAACARAVFRLARQGERGCRTILDLPPALLSPEAPETLWKTLL